MNPLNLKFKFKKSLWIIGLPKSCWRYSKGVERICGFSSSSSIIDDVMVSWAGKVWAEMRVMLLIIVLCHHVTSTGALQPDTLWHKHGRDKSCYNEEHWVLAAPGPTLHILASSSWYLEIKYHRHNLSQLPLQSSFRNCHLGISTASSSLCLWW